MSEQLLNAVPEANDPNVTDPNQIIGTCVRICALCINWFVHTCSY